MSFQREISQPAADRDEKDDRGEPNSRKDKAEEVRVDLKEREMEEKPSQAQQPKPRDFKALEAKEKEKADEPKPRDFKAIGEKEKAKQPKPRDFKAIAALDVVKDAPEEDQKVDDKE